MEAKYFPDSDILFITFSDKEIVKTQDINQDIIIQFDKNGDLVNMTIKHAKQQANIDNFSYNKVEG